MDQHQLRVTNGATLTLTENITVSQPETATGHPVYAESSHVVLDGATVTSAATSTSVYSINLNGAGSSLVATDANVTTVNGRAVYSNITTTPILLEGTNLTATGTGYSAYRGIYVLRDGTVLTGRDGGGAILYDFSATSVAATPAPADFVNGQLVSLAVTGNPAGGAVGATLRYTTDGTDPLDSPTAATYTEPFAVAPGQTVLATQVKDGHRDSLSSFEYATDGDAVPGTVASVQTLDPITRPVGTAIEPLALGLPTVLGTTLADGRTKYFQVVWDLSGIEAGNTGTTLVTGELQVAGEVSNPDAVTPSVSLTIGEAPISGFALDLASFLVEGKTSVQDGAVVGTLRAAGGDSVDYAYELAPSDLFRLDGAEVVATRPLAAGEHTISVTVTSGAQSATSEFVVAVQPANAAFVIANPYSSIDWETVHQLTTAPHTHTERTNAPLGEWSDGVAGTVAEKLAVYEGLGYDAVAITDHDNVAYPWDAVDAGDSQLIAIPGNEMSKNSHTLSYFSTYRDSAGMGPDVSVGFEANYANVGAQGGFLYLAHPSRSGGSTADPAFDLPLFDKYPQLVGLEVLNAGQYTRNHSEDLWDTLLTETMPHQPIWGTASDDSHSLSLSVTGTGWTTLLAPQRDELSARDALALGRSYFSSYRVTKGADDAKGDPGVPAPSISDIDVSQGVIKLTVDGADTIEWVSAEGSVVATGTSVDVNTAPGAAKYIRARMFGPGGQTMTQPFGLHPVDQVDTEAPTITLTDYLPPRVDLGEEWNLPTGAGSDESGATFVTSTLVDPAGQANFVLDNKVTFDQVGTYTLRYESRDGAGNVGSLEREIVVRDNRPSPAPTVTVTAAPSPAPTVTVSAAPSPMPTVTVTAQPSALPAGDLYQTPGFHRVNGRQWMTSCEPYSVTVRCWTYIWGTTVIPAGDSYVQNNGWVFNNLTYVASPRANWAGNPLGNTGEWTAADGRRWRTECDTERTGRNGCRSYTEARVIDVVEGQYRPTTRFTFNSMVRFK
nr:FN3 associated domain-containing protein [Tessaracoccus sp. OS52]